MASRGEVMGRQSRALTFFLVPKPETLTAVCFKAAAVGFCKSVGGCGRDRLAVLKVKRVHSL